MALFNFYPETPQQKEQRALEEARKQYQALLGQAPQTQLMPQEGPVRPGETLLPIQQTMQGSGLLGGQVSPQEFIARTAGMPGNIGPNIISAAKGGLLGGQTTAPFGGTGIKAQAYNQAIKYNLAKQNKQPISPQDEYAYNLVYQQLSQPSRYIDPSGQMVEVPGMDMSGFITPKGLESSRKMLGKKPMAAETAGKKAMMDVARGGIAQIEPILFTDGKVNRGLVKEAWTWIDAPEGLPFGIGRPLAQFASPEAQKLYNAFEWGKQAITRTETGAAMPTTEVENTAKRFMPKPWDSDELIQQKWVGYNLFVNNVDKYLDPNNLTAEHTYNKVMEDIKKRQGKPGGTSSVKSKVRRYNPKTGKIE